MAIQISQNSTPANAPFQEPQFQDWGPIPHFIEIPYNNATPGTFLPPLVTHTIRDVIGLPEFAQFSAFRWGASRHSVMGVAMTVYTPTASVPLGFPMSFQPLTANGTTINVTHNINTAMLNTMQPGNFSTQLRFLIQGLDSNGAWVNISSYLFQVTIRLRSQLLTFAPNGFVFNHIKGLPLPAPQNFNIDGPQWSVSVSNARFVLDATDPDVTISVEPTFNLLVAQGNGAKVLTLGLSAFYNTPPAVSGTLSLNILNGVQLVATLPIQVNVIESLRLLANALVFNAVRLVNEPIPQQVEVQSINPFTFVAPPWLIVLPFGNGVLVVPIPTVNMQRGVYTGTVVFSSVVSDVTVTQSLEVTYFLEDVISNNYLKQAFTLDQFQHTFSTFNDNSYFDVLAKIRTYSPVSLIAQDVEVSQRFPLTLAKTTKVSFGQIIHNLIKSFDAPSLETVLQRKAELILEISERNFETRELIREFITQPQTFVAGFSDFFGDGFGFLDPSPEPMRVTPNSKVFIPFTGLNGGYTTYVESTDDTPADPDDLLAVSGISVFSITQNEIIQQRIDFSNYLPGAQVTIKIFSNQLFSNPENQSVERKFIVFPPGDQSIHIVWETQFKLPHWFEFTGDYRLGTSFEQISQRLFRNRVEFLDIIETTKTVRFFANTGFVLKSDQRRIDSLMSSARAWIYFEDGSIELRPIAKELSNFDNKRQLYSYDIEFEIKRSKNEKTYSL